MLLPAPGLLCRGLFHYHMRHLGAGQREGTKLTPRGPSCLALPWLTVPSVWQAPVPASNNLLRKPLLADEGICHPTTHRAAAQPKFLSTHPFFPSAPENGGQALSLSLC